MTAKKYEEKVVYTKSTAQLDAEARAEQGDPVPWLQTENPSYGAEPTEKEAQYAVPGNDVSGYRGVSPEYMTYADDTHKPGIGGWTDELAPKPVDDAPDEGDEDEADESETKGDEDDETTTTKEGDSGVAKEPAAPRKPAAVPATKATSKPATSLKSSDK